MSSSGAISVADRFERIRSAVISSDNLSLPTLKWRLAGFSEIRWKSSSAVLIFAAWNVLLLNAGRAFADDSHLLKRPQYSTDDHLIDKVRFEFNASMTVVVDSREVELVKSDLLSRHVRVTSISKVTDGRPVEYVVDVGAEYLHLAEHEAQDSKEPDKVTALPAANDGIVTRYSLKNGAWTASVLEPETDPEDFIEPEDEFLPLDEETLLPDRPVQLGDKWTVPADRMRKLYGSDRTVKGDLECEYKTITRRDGRTYALIAWNGEVKLGPREGDVAGLSTDASMNGTTWFDLATGFQELDVAQGKMTTTGPVKDSKIPAVLKYTGNFAATCESRCLVLPATSSPQQSDGSR